MPAIRTEKRQCYSCPAEATVHVTAALHLCDDCAKQVVCIACEGSGFSSKGDECPPCDGTGLKRID